MVRAERMRNRFAVHMFIVTYTSAIVGSWNVERGWKVCKTHPNECHNWTGTCNQQSWLKKSIRMRGIRLSHSNWKCSVFGANEMGERHEALHLAEPYKLHLYLRQSPCSVRTIEHRWMPNVRTHKHSIPFNHTKNHRCAYSSHSRLNVECIRWTTVWFAPNRKPTPNIRRPVHLEKLYEEHTLLRVTGLHRSKSKLSHPTEWHGYKFIAIDETNLAENFRIQSERRTALYPAEESTHRLAFCGWTRVDNFRRRNETTGTNSH